MTNCVESSLFIPSGVAEHTDYERLADTLLTTHPSLRQIMNQLWTGRVSEFAKRWNKYRRLNGVCDWTHHGRNID